MRVLTYTPRERLSRVVDTAELLHRFWGMHAADVRHLGGGINSETWLVEHEASTYVAKRVSSTAIADLVAGCEVATALAEAGSSRADQCPPPMAGLS
ncbi:hypothetical protein BH18ACT9_BH18ACT9_02510 [soil metagenome]